MEKLTIKEIAKLAGVSPTAVSFVLNNKKGVSDKTRKKVNEVIEKTNFIPSLNSRRLFFKKSYNISLVVQQTSSPFSDLFYYEITNGILEKNKEFGYNIVFTDISMKGNSMDIPNIIKYKDTDGIIFYQDTERAILREVDKLNIPYVIVDAHSTSSDFTTINADSELLSYAATKFLIEHGHVDIALISSSYIPEYYIQIFTGYKNALEEVRVSISPYWIQNNAFDELSAYNCMENILKNPSTPSAVFCAGDIFAIGAIRCAKNKGYRVPEDISFIGIDDIILSRYIEPALTTIRIDKALMGSLAMDLLVKKINGESVESIILESDNIVVRDSVKNINCN